MFLFFARAAQLPTKFTAAAAYRFLQQDCISLSSATTPDYEAKKAMFYEEHMHEDAEVRLIIQGVGFFDVRDLSDCWVTLFSCAAIETYEPALITRLHMMLLLLKLQRCPTIVAFCLKPFCAASVLLLTFSLADAHSS